MRIVNPRTIMWVGILALPVLPQTGFGQRADTVLQRAFEQNWYVRVQTVEEGIWTSGRVRRLTPDSVTVGSMRLSRNEIRQLERRIDSGGGWRVGAAIGSIGLGLIGYGISTMCEADCTDDHLIGVFGGAAMGATIGVFIGEAVAPRRHKWQQL